MNFDIEPEDWFGKLLTGGSSRLPGRRADLFGGMFTGFAEMERMFDEQFRDMLLQTETPKELVREYVTPKGEKVREIGPIVYGYSVVVGPDGKPRITEFGNVKQGTRIGGKEGPGTRRRGSQLTAEREPLADVITTDKEVKIVVELPGVNKENIKVNAYEGSAEVIAETQDRKYRRVVDIPADTDAESVKSTFKNGLLEIAFKRKDKPKGKEIKVE
jgi:HSP20 family protein